jgi:hypothetical protein
VLSQNAKGLPSPRLVCFLLLPCPYTVLLLCLPFSHLICKPQAVVSVLFLLAVMAAFNQHIDKSNVSSRSTTEAGNGLFATRQIKLRDTVLSVNQPLMLALDTPRLKDTCYYCLVFMEKSGQIKRSDKTQAKTLKACKGCNVVRYCDKVCEVLVSRHLEYSCS